MYDMVDKEYVRKRHYVDGWSIRETSRQLKIARQTVRKLLEDAEIQKYNRQKDRPCPVKDPYRSFIENILLEDKTAPTKQHQQEYLNDLSMSLASPAESRLFAIT